MQNNLTVEDYESQVLQAHRQLLDEAKQTRRRANPFAFSVALDSWLSSPHRHFGTRARPESAEAGSVWHATGMEIADAFTAQVAHS